MANIVHWSPNRNPLSKAMTIFVDTGHILKSALPSEHEYGLFNDFNFEMLKRGHTFITSPTVINEAWNRLEIAKTNELLMKRGYNGGAYLLKDRQRELENLYDLDIKSSITSWTGKTIMFFLEHGLIVLDQPIRDYTKKIIKVKNATPIDLEVFDGSHLLYMDSAKCNTLVTTDTSFYNVKGMNVIKVVSDGNPKAGKGQLIDYKPDFYL